MGNQPPPNLDDPVELREHYNLVKTELEAIKRGLQKSGYGIMTCSNGKFIFDITESEMQRQAKSAAQASDEVTAQILADALREYTCFRPSEGGEEAYKKVSEKLVQFDKFFAKPRPTYAQLGPVIKDAEVDRNFLHIAIRGVAGTGKSTLAHSLAESARQEGFDVALVDDSPEPFFTNDLEEGKLLAAMVAADVKIVITTHRLNQETVPNAGQA